MKIYRKFIKNLQKIYKKFIKKSIENLQKIYRKLIKNLQKIYKKFITENVSAMEPEKIHKSKRRINNCETYIVDYGFIRLNNHFKRYYPLSIFGIYIDSIYR